jgi:hypothetical protein
VICITQASLAFRLAEPPELDRTGSLLERVHVRMEHCEIAASHPRAEAGQLARQVVGERRRALRGTGVNPDLGCFGPCARVQGDEGARADLSGGKGALA